MGYKSILRYLLIIVILLIAFYNCDNENDIDEANPIAPGTSTTSPDNPATANFHLVNVYLSTNYVNEGGDVNCIIIVESANTVNWLNYGLNYPSGNVYGGGLGDSFQNIGNYQWKYVFNYTVSSYAPSGTWYYLNISVKDNQNNTSETWTNLYFTVNNSHISSQPAISNVKICNSVTGGGIIKAELIIKSTSPPYFFNSMVYAPDSSIISGGGNGISDNVYTEIIPNVWKGTQSIWLPSTPTGNYRLENISIQNHGFMTSDVDATSYILTNH